MSDFDLHLAPPPDSNSPVPKFLIAAAVMIVVAVAVYMLNPRKTAEISVQNVQIFAPHTEFKAESGPNQVIGTQPTSEDDLYVIATVTITDKLRVPIFFDSDSVQLTLADGSTLEATVAHAAELPQLEQTFPQILSMLKPPTAPPFSFDDAIAPGATRAGSLVLLFPQITAQAWNTKKSAVLTINLEHDTVPLTIPVK